MAAGNAVKYGGRVVLHFIKQPNLMYIPHVHYLFVLA